MTSRRLAATVALMLSTQAARADDAPPRADVCACPCEGSGPDTEEREPERPRAPIDLNRAGEAALVALPGIGAARARAILAYRAEHGGFRSVAQLLHIRGIGRALLKQLRPLVMVGPRAATGGG